ncbi:MAG: hypothetical protein JNL67_07955 [Planctomycetaceae bacterium]|nr:hypothetical protein [Planctomycetaceae bacterium]
MKSPRVAGRFRKLGHWMFVSAAVILLIGMGVASTGFPPGQRLAAAEEPRLMYQDQDQRVKLWQQVDEALGAGLPQTAVEHLNTIRQSAEQDGAQAEALKALCLKLALEASLDQPAAPKMIRGLEAALPELPPTMQPLAKGVLATWYFSYFQQNRWQFAQRSQTESPPSDDFETWDLKQFLKHVDQLYRDALSAEAELQKIAIGDVAAILTDVPAADEFRPTLFDFIAFQSLDFYQLDEQIIRQQGSFQVAADSLAFSSLDQFIAWMPETEDEDSYVLQAIRVYQSLLKFHAQDENRSARLDVDLQRLEFMNQVAFGSEKTARYEAALQRYADQHQDHPLSSLALARLAGSKWSNKNAKEAHQLACRGRDRFPTSRGAAQCRNLIQEIEAKNLSIQTERIWNSAGPTLQISARNLDKVYFRLVAFDFEKWSSWGMYQDPTNMEYEERLKLGTRPAAASWTVELPTRDDYQSVYKEAGQLPDVKPGCYLLLASAHPDFVVENNQLSLTEIWVSDLAMLIREDYKSNEVIGQVVNALDGQPQVGATVTVRAWKQDGRNSREEVRPDLTTDVNGFFRLAREQQVTYKFVAKVDSDSLGFVDNRWYYGQDREDRSTQRFAMFFTDRSIYRPGQTIQFKGILHEANQSEAVYRAVGGRRVKIGLWDMNNELVDQLQLTSNEYGSFSGSFVAARERATGPMRIGMLEGPFEGNHTVRVEEYKRPKFYAEVASPEQQFQLNELVTVKGKATAYTGAPIDGAKVTYRVVREVRYPNWWMWRCWYCPPMQGESQEIANGTLRTQLDGSFDIPFQALPDLKVDRGSQPVFSFTVYADVTDSAGETRSANTTIRLGYTSLEASVTVDTWQTTSSPTEIKCQVTNLDGQPQSVAGSLKIFSLKAPEKVQRGQLPGLYSYRLNYLGELALRGSAIDGDLTKPDLSQINYWPSDAEVVAVELKTDGEGRVNHQLELPEGAYRVQWQTVDRSGQNILAEETFQVIDKNKAKFGIKIPHFLSAEKWSVEPGEKFSAVWGTGYESGRAFVQWVHRGKVMQEFWTDATTTQVPLEFTPTEEHRGGFQLLISYVRDNRIYLESRTISVPWTSKQLTVKWERFVSKLQPGQKETWTAVISGPESKTAAAEMVATLYDASLDAFSPHGFASTFGTFYQDYLYWSVSHSNRLQVFNVYHYGWHGEYHDPNFYYRQFDQRLLLDNWSYGDMVFGGMPGGGGGGRMMRMRGGLGGAMEQAEMMSDAAPMPAMSAAPMAKSAEARTESMQLGEQQNQPGSSSASPTPTAPNLDQVQTRQNLNETAFFFPHVVSGDDGVVRLEFQMPEALTKWKFMGFVHDTQLRSGLLTDEVVTSKDLMVQPNPPRFLREGDVLEFSVKILNQSATRQTGRAKLSLSNLQTDESMSQALGLPTEEQEFDIPAGQSISLYWMLNVPDFSGVLGYRVVAATERLSDGEEGFLPVLSKRVLVKEALPLPIRGQTTKQFEFQSLLKAGESDSLRHQSLTVQMTSNPTWYAVMALPYLMENQYPSSESIFSRLYANALGQHIVGSNPRIERIFQQWEGTDALDSPLEKNEDLKNILIQQSPWLRDAKSESQARRQVAVMFDKNRMQAELANAQQRLAQMQYSDGAWPWCPGGPANDYITLHIVTGMGRLRHLGVEIDTAMAVKALDRLDHFADQTYQRILQNKHEQNNNLSSTIAMYLYGRSFFLQDQAIDAKYKPAVDYFLQQARDHWLTLDARLPQGYVAIALQRFGDLQTPKKIVASLTERSLSDEEMGMFWREGQARWRWWEAKIETQAMMIEVFDEVAADAERVEELKVWLLKQKQTQNWDSTKGTTDAIYALLLRGTSGLASTQLVEVQLGTTKIEPQQTEAGTGFYQERLVRGEIDPSLGQITVTKKDAGVAWGSVHWQYLEDISKVKAYSESPLNLTKSLFKKVNTPEGPVIQPVSGPLEVGDQVVVRLELRTDRDLEYVYLKDDRGSGTEPVDVLSVYRYQDGLGYYQSTRDTGSHFFFESLPRGVYVFEYSVRVQHRGQYQTGMALLECLYAPEFNGHSQSLPMEVK